MRSIEQLTQEVLSLPSASRALLADKLVESLEFDTNPTMRRRFSRRSGSLVKGSVCFNLGTAQKSNSMLKKHLN